MEHWNSFPYTLETLKNGFHELKSAHDQILKRVWILNVSLEYGQVITLIFKKLYNLRITYQTKVLFVGCHCKDVTLQFLSGQQTSSKINFLEIIFHICTTPFSVPTPR